MLRKEFDVLHGPICHDIRLVWNSKNCCPLMCLFVLQQTKRKLDDANKRLEFLYDKLREQTVSSVLLPPSLNHI